MGNNYYRCKDGDFLNIIILFAAGLLSGAIGAMGIGGGIILIPVLTFVFDITQKSAQYINLIYFVPVAIAALFIHMRAGRIMWKTALIMIIPGVAGAIAGSALAGIISTGILRRLFGIFLFAVGIKQLGKLKKDSMEE